MATRFLSFLEDIEEALRKEAATNLGVTWEMHRTVNHQHQLARTTLIPPGYTVGTQLRGAIFVQGFALADGSLCLKVSLNWQGSDAFPTIPIYSKVLVDWKKEAALIASRWLAGPPSAIITHSRQEYSALLAAAS